MTREDRRIAAGLFLVAFVTFAWFFGGGGWNQNAQFDLMRAVVERRTFYVDGYAVNTGDLSTGWRGHTYINKPPGVSLLAAIPYAPVYAIERAFHMPIDRWLLMTVNAWIVTVLTCGVTGALIPAVLYLYMRRRAGSSPLAAAAIAYAIAFGTIIFPYSTMLFAHVPAALFLLLAFVWHDRRPLLAGVCAGIAGLCFYFCIPAAAVILVLVLTRSWKSALRFVAGGIPFGILLGWYHYECFGSPWRTSVESSGGFTEQGKLFGVIGKPAIDALWGITFSPYRGLFYSSPILLVAILGIIMMITRRAMLRELTAIVVISLIFIIGTASFNGWSGGSAFGPRYLLPIVPLLAIPMTFAVPMFRILYIVLGVVSIAINFIATAVDPMPSALLDDPLRTYIVSPFLTGHLPRKTAEAFKMSSHVGKVGINVQTIDEPGPWMTYPAGSREAEWAAFNLGELLFGSGGRSSVVPIAIWMVAGAFTLAAVARRALT